MFDFGMFNPFTWGKGGGIVPPRENQENKNDVREEKKKADLGVLVSVCNKELMEATEDFNKKPCAMNNMKPCDGKCVHYQAGCVSYYGVGVHIHDKQPYSIRPYVVNPSCKLWRQQN